MSVTPEKVEGQRSAAPREADRYDPMTGRPVQRARYDTETGKPLRSGHTSFIPPFRGWGYWAMYGAWGAFNAMMAWFVSSIPPSEMDGTESSPGQLAAMAIIMFILGAGVIALANFGYRKARHLP